MNTEKIPITLRTGRTFKVYLSKQANVFGCGMSPGDIWRWIPLPPQPSAASSRAWHMRGLAQSLQPFQQAETE